MKEFYFYVYMILVGLASPMFVFYDRKYDLWLWNTDTVLGGMEKLNLFGDTEFISLGQYAIGMLFYSGAAFYIWLAIFICLEIKNKLGNKMRNKKGGKKL